MSVAQSQRVCVCVGGSVGGWALRGTTPSLDPLLLSSSVRNEISAAVPEQHGAV